MILYKTFLLSIFMIIVFCSQCFALSFENESRLIERVDLEWLSPELSLSISFDGMSLMLNNSESDFYNLRFATTEEVNSLITFYTGIDFTGTSGSLFYNHELDQFANDFDIAVDSYFYGYMNTPNPSFGVDHPVSLGYILISDRFHQYNIDGLHVSMLDIASPSMGSWLVRDAAPVPEPSTFILLWIGLVGLVGYRMSRVNH